MGGDEDRMAVRLVCQFRGRECSVGIIPMEKSIEPQFMDMIFAAVCGLRVCSESAIWSHKGAVSMAMMESSPLAAAPSAAAPDWSCWASPSCAPPRCCPSRPSSPSAEPCSRRERYFLRKGAITNVHCRPNFLQSSHAASLPWSLHWIFRDRQRSQGRCFLERYLRPVLPSATASGLMNTGRTCALGINLMVCTEEPHERG